MAQISTFTATVNGGNFLLNAAANGDTAACGNGEKLIVKNGDAASKIVTIAVPGNLQTGDAYPDKAYTIPAGEMWVIPLYDFYADPTDGLAHITYSALTSVTRGVLKG